MERARMRAVVLERYGPPEVVRVADVARPEPAAGEVLVRVCASSVTRSDVELRGAVYGFTRVFTGLRRPRQRIAGMEFSGVVEAVGDAVARFRVGDEVFGIRSGANAEYVRVRELGVIAHRPATVTLAQAAALPDGACTAIAFLRQAGVRAGQRVLVYGASGSIGTAAVQLARHAGVDVTAVCGPRHLELVRSLGATQVFDHQQHDITAIGDAFDVVIDAVGVLSARGSLRLLAPGGVYLTAGSPSSLLPVVALAVATRLAGGRRIRLGVAEYRQADLEHVRDLVERGAYRPVIDRTYPLDEVVAAHRYVDSGRKAGNVLLSVGADCTG